MESDTFYRDFMVKLVWRLSRDSMKSDAFNGDFMVTLVLRLFDNLIYHVFSIKVKTPDKLHNFYIL